LHAVGIAAFASLIGIALALVADWPAWAYAPATLAPWLVLSALAVRWTSQHVRWMARTFPHLSASLLVETTGRMQRSRYAPGDVIVAEGEPADRFYVVTAGEAEVARRDGDRDVHLSTYQPGDFFGEVGLLTSTQRMATVRAISGVEVLSLDQGTFGRVVEDSGLTAEDLARVARERSAQTEPRDDAVPLPPWSRVLSRMTKHPRAMHYNRLIGLVLLVNLLVGAYAVARGHWWSGDVIDLPAIVLVAQANFALAILFRQQYVINGIAWIATRPPTTWPLRLRWALGKYYHFGGLHVGAAIAGIFWYAAFVGSLFAERFRGNNDVSTANMVVSCAVVVLFIVTAIMAMPRLRTRSHDRFEATHRFCGWAALALIWINTVLFLTDHHLSLLTAPTMWMLVVTTIGAAWPWLLLRKIAIRAERPSRHAALIHLDHDVQPGLGTTRPISRNPWIGWHHFANLPNRDGSPGYRMVVSRAGDWTTAFIDDPPAAVWVRGIPVIGVANVRKLFRKVVFVATGSGIGPMLAHLLAREPPSRLVWVTKDPRVTYGDELIDEILTAQPDAVLWNTDERGKPDVLRLAYAAYLDSGAEAVICIANRQVTWQIVHGLERRGIPAFGPIWDS
jgi:CRP-like cAMP-binding protein